MSETWTPRGRSLRTADLEALLAGAPFLDGLGAEVVDEVAAACELVHIEGDQRANYERVARTLTRSGVAVVLSGGGARGIAHVGVLKALEEARVPVDAIAGTSMGSIIGAGYARGWNADQIVAKMRELFRSRIALYDPTLPFESLLAGRKLERVLRGYFGGLKIENLWLPFFCVSTDLARAQLRVHDRGDCTRAVASSCSISGIFPPQRFGHDQLVDGGIAAVEGFGLLDWGAYEELYAAGYACARERFASWEPPRGAKTAPPQ